jgi:hypothetical protein
MPGAIINDTPEKAIRCPGLEPYDKRLSRTVLRGLGGRKASWLPDRFRAGECGRDELRCRLIPLWARMGGLCSAARRTRTAKPQDCVGT